MYNRTPYNKTTYNRTTSIVFEWLATANAETDTSATLKIIRYLDGSAAAVATASGVFVRVLLPSALAEAEARKRRRLYPHSLFLRACGGRSNGERYGRFDLRLRHYGN